MLNARNRVRGSSRRARLLTGAVASLAGACAGDTGDAAGGSPSASPGSSEPLRQCAADPSESIIITSQAELNALEGCESFDGTISILPPSGSLDLRPLAQLRRVGQLYIGCNPYAGLEANCTGYSDVAVTSLEGLNALEEAVRLQLAQLRISTLAPLAALKRVGFLGVTACPGLTQLTGLGQLERVDSLELIGNDGLRSLDGLPQLPGLRALVLEDDPALADIGALRGSLRAAQLVAVNGAPVEDLSPLGALDAVTSLHLNGTRARNLDGVELKTVMLLSIGNNPVLEQVDALGALETFGDLSVADNAQLSSLPEFPRVSEFFSLSVSFNPALASGPAFPNLVQGRASTIIFEGNPALTRLDGFRSLAVGGYISVIENAALRSLDLSSLEQVDSMRVLCNPELSAEALAPLGAVQGDVTLPGDSAVACQL